MSAPDAGLVARFARDLAALGVPEGPVALAVSGGADSMAMLVLATAALPGRVLAATVDHRLRAGSAAEAAMVAAHCARLAVPHATLHPAAPLDGPDLQARARAARYALLAAWVAERGAGCLLTAHHADDQAETFLMRAVRGAGPAGLAGVRARRPLAEGCDLPLLRPLLGWRRTELRAIVTATTTPFVDDPSNSDSRFERARVRALLAGEPILDAAGLAGAAAHAGEAAAALDAMTEWLWRTRRVAGEGVAIEVAELPRELRRRLAREAIAAFVPDFDRATNIEPLLAALDAGRAATQGPVMAVPRGTIWRFVPAPPRRAH